MHSFHPLLYELFRFKTFNGHFKCNCVFYERFRLIFIVLISKDIINKILVPTLDAISNTSLKFPNGHISRHILCFKILDIILLLCHRLGREISHVQMEYILKKYFDGFSVLNTSSNTSILLKFSNEIPNALSPKLSENNELIKPYSTRHKKTNSLGEIIKNRLNSGSFNLISLKNEDIEYEKVTNSTVNHDESNLNEEFLLTFTPELAHAAYFSISRYISSNFVDSILSNHVLIHELCMKHSKNLRDESENNSINESAISLNKKRNFNFDESGVINARSHGSSFNENISFTGNQIQFNISDSIHEKISYKNVDYLNKAFSINFNEKDLRE